MKTMPYLRLEDNLSQQKRYRDAHRKAGICTRCTKPAKKGAKLCKKHLSYARKANKKMSRDKKRLHSISTNQKLKEDVFSRYGDLCLCCGESERKFLTVDHINGRHDLHRPENRMTGTGLYRWLRQNNFPPGFRILCYNCNSSMGVYGTCPHENLPPQSTNHPANPYKKAKF